jgi:uncharacterized repeat protein (TIGR03803 family)
MKPRAHSRILRGAAICFVIFISILVSLGAAAWGQATETILENFSGAPNASVGSGAHLARDAAGNLYGANGVSVFKLSRAANGVWKQSILHAFYGCCIDTDAGNVPTSVIVDAAGNLYGTTLDGGIMNGCYVEGSGVGCGVIFELSLDSSGVWTEKVLHAFTGGSDGAYPVGSLVLDAAGNLYGTAEYGGSGSCQSEWYGGCGVVFKLSPGAGGKWTETVLYSFTGGSDGANPYGNVIFDRSGNLYSTTLTGGDDSGCPGTYGYTSGCGVVFELSPSSGSWTENVLYTFTNQSDGGYPLSGVVMDAKGNLYGEAQGGAQGYGVAFQLSPSSGGSWTQTVLSSFSATEAYPRGGLSVDSAGNLYGTVSDYPYSYAGEVFKFSPAEGGGWIYNVVYSFTGVADGAHPSGGVILDSAGSLYGVASGGGGNGCYPGAASGCGLIFEISQTAGAWKETVLFDAFSGGAIQPMAGVVEDASGNFYGTTSAGGANAWGTIYEAAPIAGGWKTQILYSFTGYADGGFPVAALTRDAAGNLYGTTENGGSGNCYRGCGTVFKLSPAGSGKWQLSVLHDFQGGSDGANPVAGVVLDSAGNVYGTTEYGGGGCTNNYCGTVFELSPSGAGWHETILHRFHSTSDGSYPLGGLVFDSSGNLYGTTLRGGSSSAFCGLGCGVVFELSSGAHAFSVIHAFAGNSVDGSGPEAGLIIDDLGNLYGSAENGPNNALGMVFELTPLSGGTWQESVLASGLSLFGGPVSGVVMDSHGNLFGSVGGTSELGYPIYEVSPKSGGGWTEQTYFTLNFAPGGNLWLDAAGNLYGTSISGPTNNSEGTLYEVMP